ncbi:MULTISPECIES: helix-turn-helix transcriptional regulator [unclassified Rathayibacter]|uniref:helix-turn-helix transcriptional regulator n=1 Tax=unclassified Rathayibacter TaxID=2609250 RepID=UPI000A8FAF0F
MTSASSRVLRLLSLLQVRRVWPGELLSERLEITPRTVRRDIDRLRGMGYRIRAIKGPDGGYRLDALRFTTMTPEAPVVAPEVLVAVSAAVRAREVLRFDYSGAEVPRRVEPHHLVSRERRWYLVGWDLDRDDWRVSRADRLAPRTPRGARSLEAVSQRSSTPGSWAEKRVAAGRAGAP